MNWLATSKHWQVFIFLIAVFWLQLVFEFFEIFANDVPEISSLAFSMASMGLTLIWIREVGMAVSTGSNTLRLLIFTIVCWAAATCFIYFGALSTLAEDPEIFLQPSYLRPMFFVAIWAFMGCTIFAATKIEQAENPDAVSWVNIANSSLLLALSLIGVWSIQPKIQGLQNK